MKKRIRFIIVVLMFGVLMTQRPQMAFAETEGSVEGGSMVVPIPGNSSADATLSSLKIAQADLHPAFDPGQLTYTATVPYEVERVALNAKTNCPEARKVITGTGDLEVGENTIIITVTAENGSTKTYRILVTRQELPEGVTLESTEEESTAGEETTEELSTEEFTQPQTPPSFESESDDGMVVETLGEDSTELFGLSRRTIMILLMAAICLVAIFAIVAIIVALRERDDEDDEDDVEVDPEEEEEEAPVSDSPLQAAVEELPAPENEQKNDLDEELDDDFELMLEDDDDFDFLDF